MITKMGERIKGLRMELEMSQDELARRTNVTQPKISAWESGVEPKISKIIDLCFALDTTPNYLLTGKN